jgi:hypothetical protein
MLRKKTFAFREKVRNCVIFYYLFLGEALLANILVDFDICESVGDIPAGTIGREQHKFYLPTGYFFYASRIYIWYASTA